MSKEERVLKFEEGLEYMHKHQEALFSHKEEQRRRLEHFLMVAR